MNIIRVLHYAIYVILFLLLILLSIGLYKMQYKQKSIEELLYHMQAKIEVIEKVEHVAPVIHKIISSQEPWRDLQISLENTVVQIFSQIAEIDVLEPQKTPNQYQVTGSGFLINKEGEIITNAHVVNQARAVWIQIPFFGKRQFDVEVIGVSPDRDIALLRLGEEGIEAIKQEIDKPLFLILGDSDEVHRADEILTLGYPLGQQGLKSTKGVVSGREKHLIQIDAAINPGSSGGPSINSEGQVIGINTMYAPKAQNVGYIIPINELKVIMDDLHRVKLLRRPFLGILYNNASENLTKFLGNPQPGGLFVVDVYTGSPLHKAGVKRRDMVYEINGHRVDIYGEFSWIEGKISIVDYVAQLKLGDPVRIVLYRWGKRKEITFNFEQAEPLPIHKIYPGYEDIDYEIIAGMLIQPLMINHLPLLINVAPSLAKYADMKNQMESAVIITHIFPDSQAQRSRSFGSGIIIKEINGEPVGKLDDVRKELFKSFETNELSIETTDGVFDVFSFNKVLNEERRLSNNWEYDLSKVVRILVEKQEQQERATANLQQSEHKLLPVNIDK